MVQHGRAGVMCRQKMPEVPPYFLGNVHSLLPLRQNEGGFASLCHFVFAKLISDRCHEKKLKDYPDVSAPTRPFGAIHLFGMNDGGGIEY